jgi:hypothetical protein
VGPSEAAVFCRQSSVLPLYSAAYGVGIRDVATHKKVHKGLRVADLITMVQPSRSHLQPAIRKMHSLNGCALKIYRAVNVGSAVMREGLPSDRRIYKDRRVRIIIECPENILHLETEYADCPLAQLQSSCSPAADHTFSTN